MCIDFIGVCSVVCMYECNLETLCLTWNGSSAWHMTFFSSFKTFLFPCQAKKATIPTRLTLMIWHKKLFLLNQVWKFNFWREILKSSNNFISMSGEESHYSDKVDIKMKLSFVDFFPHFWREILKSSNYFVFPCRSKKAITNEGGLMIWQLT